MTHSGILKDIDEHFMFEALKEARKAKERDEVPVGAVIVYEDVIIARAHNQREILRDPTAHAEIIALTQAAEALDGWRLEGAVIYVTLEPCLMCAGALVNSRISRLVFGALDPKGGCVSSKLDIDAIGLNHKFQITSGILEKECQAELVEFFEKKRK